MTDEWIQFLDQINETIKKWDEDDECDFPVFRGQADETWDLQPSLMRLKKAMEPEEFSRLEGALYFDFVTYSAKATKFQTSWETLFEMRHHGLPTRLLDWSENFAMALYFALSDNAKSPTIWMLNPYKLNKLTTDDDSLFNPIELKFNYAGGFLDVQMKYDLLTQTTRPVSEQPYDEPIAIVPPLSSDRLFAQKGLFTLQGKGDDTPLNKSAKFSQCYVKMTIPNNALNDALAFIQLSGINEFSAYPDLDGLSRYLQAKYKISRKDIIEREKKHEPILDSMIILKLTAK